MSFGFASNSSLKQAVRGATLGTATSSFVGAVRVDGSSILVDVTGTISVPVATTAVTGLARPDGTSILVASGVISLGRYNTRATSLGTSVSSFTPNLSLFDQYSVSSQSATLTINAPTGSPADGQKLLFRIIDNGVSQTLTWNSSYTAVGAVIPTTTTAGKMTYVGCIYNAVNLRWDVIAVATQV
jgi:hypothetical protein